MLHVAPQPERESAVHLRAPYAPPQPQQMVQPLDMTATSTSFHETTGTFSIDMHSLNMSISDLRKDFRNMAKTVSLLESKEAMQEENFRKEVSSKQPIEGFSSSTSSILHRLGLDDPDSFLGRSNRNSSILDELSELDALEDDRLALPQSPERLR